jgi:hypothetical protein
MLSSSGLRGRIFRLMRNILLGIVDIIGAAHTPARSITQQEHPRANCRLSIWSHKLLIPLSTCVLRDEREQRGRGELLQKSVG